MQVIYIEYIAVVILSRCCIVKRHGIVIQYLQLMSDTSMVLAWVSGTCPNVACYSRVSTTNLRPNTTGKIEVGVGGKIKINAIADSDIFGKPDVLILSADSARGSKGIPKMLSVSKSTQARADKPKEAFIFTATGAVRTILTNDDCKTVAVMTEKAEQQRRFK